MVLVALVLSALAATGSPQGAPAETRASGFWILVCEMPTAGAGEPADGRRTFRLGPQSFQEWKSDRMAFGSNLCRSFSCSSEAGRMEGTIRSASLHLTISLDPQTRSATWRTVGASGLARTSGSCTVEPESEPAGHGQ